MSGGLDLAQPGLAPGKKRQAALGALTLKRTASRPDAAIRLFQNRHRAAMRWRVWLAGLPDDTSLILPLLPVLRRAGKGAGHSATP
jgi:hypothetical protein